MDLKILWKVNMCLYINKDAGIKKQRYHFADTGPYI